DPAERFIPGDGLPLVRPGCPVLRPQQAARTVDEVEQTRSLRAQGAAIHRVIRIAFDVDDGSLGVLRSISEAVHHDSAGPSAIRAGVARLRRTRKFELADFGDGDRRGEAHECQTRAGERGAGYLQELAPGEVGHANPSMCRAGGAPSGSKSMPLNAL